MVAQGASAACERMGTKIAEPLSPSANPSSQGCPGKTLRIPPDVHTLKYSASTWSASEDTR